MNGPVAGSGAARTPTGRMAAGPECLIYDTENDNLVGLRDDLERLTVRTEPKDRGDRSPVTIRNRFDNGLTGSFVKRTRRCVRPHVRVRSPIARFHYLNVRNPLGRFRPAHGAFSLSEGRVLPLVPPIDRADYLYLYHCRVPASRLFRCADSGVRDHRTRARSRRRAFVLEVSQ
ncbi:hypothetical protein EVAR_11924_1 [Eumeta japonica]|uniref:Uncharacterized protein n=1 Tax=Eumeta variegata TaxID=151549 RepID=A0A4C1U7X5_EUMVA|nr:hypothetical protein EVAR_11924_1 [Eumeta japonica]